MSEFNKKVIKAFENIQKEHDKKIVVYYIKRDDYLKMIRDNNFLVPSYNPHIFLEPLQRFDVNSFRAFIGTGSEYIGKNDMLTYEFYSDFKNKEPGLFTPDNLSFYEILGFNFTLGNRTEVNLRRIKSEYYEKNTAFMLMPFNDENLKTLYIKILKSFY